MTLPLRGDVLVGDEVHAVPRRADEADVADGVESSQLVERYTLVQEVNRHELDGAEIRPLMRPTSSLTTARRFWILLHVLPARHGDLHQHDLADPFWVLGQEHLQGVKLLRAHP